MAKKNIKVNYFYPAVKTKDDKLKLANLTAVFDGLKDVEPNKRIIKDGEGNIQLKKIKFNQEYDRWELCFLRNKSDAPFITKLNDEVEAAEALDEDEFVGQECCLIYDSLTHIICLQSNRSSTSFTGIAEFINKFREGAIHLSPILYKDKYCEISDDESIEYKSVIIGYTDISQIQELAISEDSKAIEFLAKLTSDISAISGKVELSVGRSKNFLKKIQLKELAGFFKRNKSVTKSLKVKVLDDGTIRVLDLLNNKVNDDFDINVTKSDPKTFYKILNGMHSVFDVALENTFDKCKKLV